MYGEAVVFLRPGLGEQVRFVRKQAAQLPSKMRFVAAQFEALLTEGLWLLAAGHANAMAARLAERLSEVPGVVIPRPHEVNAVFVRLPSAAAVADLQEWSFVWDWDVAAHEVRAMTSFATTPDDVDRFAEGVAAVTARHA
jgi:threonine aldolase